MARYSFICLQCGKKCYTDQNAYRQKQQNPICDCCEQKTNLLDSNEDAQQDEGFLEGVGQLLVRGIRKIGDGITQSENADTSEVRSLSDVGRTTFRRFTDTAKCALEEVLDHQEPLKRQWEYIGCLGEVYDKHRDILSRYNDCVGLYMHKMNGEIMYIGRAVEYNNGGFRKRLSDYCRDSDSARKHPSGQKIYINRYKIKTYLLVVGKDTEAAQETKLLEKQYVAKYNPPWNDKLKTK